MGFLVSLLGNKTAVIGIVLAIILSSFGIYVAILKSQLKSIKSDLEVKTVTLHETQQALQISQDSVKTLQISISTQNDAIDKMQRESQQREELGKKEIAAAQIVADKYKDTAMAMLRRPAPPQTANKCDAANSLINEEIIRAKK